MAKSKKNKNKTAQQKAYARAQKIAATLEHETADVAHRIWLAGIGAYGKAFDEARGGFSNIGEQSGHVFDELVQRGEEIESDVRARLTGNETVVKAGQQIQDYVARANEFQDVARERFEDRMQRMRDVLGLKGIGKKASKLNAKLDKLEDEVAELAAHAKRKAGDKAIRKRLKRLSAEIEALADEGVEIAKAPVYKAAMKVKKATEPKARHNNAKTRPVAKAAATTKKAAGKPAKKAPAKKSTRASTADDLKLITGIGPALEKKLHAAGIRTFAQIAALSKADAEALDEKLTLRGRIIRDKWMKQAKILAA